MTLRLKPPSGSFTPIATTSREEQIAQIVPLLEFITREHQDARGETLPFGLRRAGQWRRPLTSTRMTGDDIPDGWEVWTDQVFVPEDDTGPERVNATAGAISLQFLSGYAIFADPGAVAHVHDFAESLLPLQWADPAKLNYGGFQAGPESSAASAFGTGLMGLALLEAWRATGEPRYRDAAQRAADFCLRLADPNAYWFATYGVNPINRAVGDVTWYGFCDEVDAADKISTRCSTLNLKAAELCLEMYQITGTTAYLTAATDARDFMATGAGIGPDGVDGPYDYFAVSHNVDATYIAVEDYNDHAWKRAGDIVATTTVGTDGVEYALPALINLAYDVDTVLEAYDAIVARPPFDPGSAFGQGFDSRICWTGYLRTGVFYGSYYDVQGAGTLAGLKAKYRPAHYELSLPMLRSVPFKSGIQDENQDAIWSLLAGVYYWNTQGTIVVAGAALGMLKALRGLV